jgi:branched-chain amino acid transport system permease protein
MEYFVQQLINGLTLGSIYGLIAIGYTMVYGIIGMINFAHGDIFMIGSFIALAMFLILTTVLGFAFLPVVLLIVLIVSMVFTSAWGWTVERLAYRPLRGSFRLAPLITAIGMSILLQNFVRVTQGARVKPLPPQIQGGVTLFQGDTATGAMVVQLSYMQIIIIVTTVVLMAGFTLLINKTALGRAQRACEQDRKMAALLGVNVDRTISLTFVMGAAPSRSWPSCSSSCPRACSASLKSKRSDPWRTLQIPVSRIRFATPSSPPCWSRSSASSSSRSGPRSRRVGSRSPRAGDCGSRASPSSSRRGSG